MKKNFIEELSRKVILMKKRNKSRFVDRFLSMSIIITVFVLTIITSIGYAALNTELSISGEAKVIATTFWEYWYTGAVQEFTAPISGYYFVELGGAQAGGWSLSGLGDGIGAYTNGYIYIEQGTTLYIYVGQYGNWNQSTRTFNGGGASGSGGVAGGGATDIRLEKALNNSDWQSTIRSRIMVAAGAGGKDDGINSDGGGLYGTTPYNLQSSFYGTIPTQTSGGKSASFNEWWESTEHGVFGLGANDADSEAWGWTDYASGGGGGYYGGGSTSKAGSSGGGSSFISGFAGVNAITASGGTATAPTHTNNTLHYSGYYFIYAKMGAGGAGLSYNGYAKITYKGLTFEKTNTSINSVRYIKSCINGNNVDGYNYWTEIQAIKNGSNIAKGKTVTATFTASSDSNLSLSNIVDGVLETSGATYGSIIGNQCVTVDLGATYDLDQLGLWLNWDNNRIYENNILSVSSDNSNWRTLHNYTSANGKVETYEGYNYYAW